MNTVVNLMDFKGRAHGIPTLVLIDLHYDLSGFAELDGCAATADAIGNCRLALKHARSAGIPVAFTRQVTPPKNMLSSVTYPRWIEGFEPQRWDMIFDRQRPSCYASADFREMVDDIGGKYVMAGQFGELSCLSTAIDAFHRDHRPTFLADAVVSRAYDDIPAGAMLRAVTSILSHYAAATNTRPWILATSRRLGASA